MVDFAFYRVGLLNLLSPDVFPGVKIVKNALAVGTLHRPSLRELTGRRWKGKGGNEKRG